MPVYLVTYDIDQDVGDPGKRERALLKLLEDRTAAPHMVTESVYAVVSELEPSPLFELLFATLDRKRDRLSVNVAGKGVAKLLPEHQGGFDLRFSQVD